MRIRTYALAVMAIVLSLSVPTRAQDENIQTVTIQSWNYCSGAVNDNCVARTGPRSVEAFTKDGTSVGTHDFSDVKFPSQHVLNSDYNIVRLSDRGCAGASGGDQSCWIETRLVEIEYCVSGAAPLSGSGGPKSEEATSMGSGKGCRQ